MFAKRLLQFAVAGAELFVASLLFDWVFMCYENLVELYGLDLSIFFQTLTHWTDFHGEVFAIVGSVAISLALLCHAFRLIVYEKF